jgi:hypothetical protein
MTPPNFNWFLHTMLFYHTNNVIKKQAKRARRQEAEVDNNDGSDSDDNDKEE